MNPIVGWVLAACALAAGWRFYGAPGLALAGTVIVFWLLLQLSRALRAMRSASEAPVGSVASAVMLNAQLRPGLQTMAVMRLTKSLGRRVASGSSTAEPGGRASGAGADEVLAWQDRGGAEVFVTFRNGRVATWELRRPPETAE